MNLKHRVKVLQEEIKTMMVEREREYMNCEREIMMFALKETEWKREREKLREEVALLRKTAEEREEKIREMVRDKMGIMEKGEENSGKEWELMGTKLLVEKMKEERARRDEAVEKWKQLYLEIKTELDDLIQRTYNGDGVCWKQAEENEVEMEKLKAELQDKEGTIKSLKSQLESLEQQKKKKEREFDLLRQSLRIMNANKNSSSLQTKEKLLKKC